jgi:hypothetical protein
LETSVWGAYHNVAVNLDGLSDMSGKEDQLAEMEDEVRIAQEGLQTVLSALAKRKGK